MHEFLSRGFNATVLRINPDLGSLGFHADLVRIESNPDPNLAEKLYLENLMVRIVFPNNFIEAVGFNSDQPSRYNPRGVLQRFKSFFSSPYNQPIHYLYSLEAPVPAEHAIYSNHMVDLARGTKRETADCEDCIKHRQFHLVKDLRSRVQEIHDKGLAFGLTIPVNDTSDYCLSSATDDVIIFECDRFEISDYISGIHSIIDSTQKQLALALSRRYLEINTGGSGATIGYALRALGVIN